MQKLARIFNAVAEKIWTPTLVTRKGIKQVAIDVTGERPWTNDFQIQGQQHEWFEARATGVDEYRVFHISQRKHKASGVSKVKPIESVYRNPKNHTPFFTRAEVIEFLTVLESSMMRDRKLQVGFAPKSWGLFKRYYK